MSCQRLQTSCVHTIHFAVDMSCSGANLFDPVTGQEVVFVRSCTDGSISILPSANMQSVAVLPVLIAPVWNLARTGHRRSTTTTLQSDAAPVGKDTAVNQRLFETIIIASDRRSDSK